MLPAFYPFCVLNNSVDLFIILEVFFKNWWFFIVHLYCKVRHLKSNWKPNTWHQDLSGGFQFWAIEQIINSILAGSLIAQWLQVFLLGFISFLRNSRILQYLTCWYKPDRQPFGSWVKERGWLSFSSPHLSAVPGVPESRGLWFDDSSNKLPVFLCPCGWVEWEE